MSTTERAVLFRLKAIPDSQNKRVFEELAKLAIDTQSAIDRGYQNTAKRQRAAIDQMSRAEIAAADRADRSAMNTIKRINERQRAEDAAAKSALQRASIQQQINLRQADWEQRQADRKRREADRETVAEKRQADEAAKAQKRLESAAIDAGSKSRAATSAMAAGYKTATAGALTLGRGIAMLGLVGEKDTEKLLRGLVKIQATIDTTKGAIDLVQGAVKAYRAYRAAVDAAAASQAALSAIEAASAGRSAAGAAGRVAGGAASGAAGSALAGGLGNVGMGVASAKLGLLAVAAASATAGFTVIGEALIGSADDLDSWTTKIAEAEAGFASWVAQKLGFDPQGDKQTADREKKRASMLEHYASQEEAARKNLAGVLEQERQRLEIQSKRNFNSLGELGGARQNAIDVGGSLQGALSAQQTFIGGMRSAAGNETAFEHYKQGVLEALQAQEQAQRDLHAQNERVNKAAIDAGKTRLGQLAEEKKRLEEVARSAKDRFMSAAERFAQMTPEEQESAKRAKMAADKGDELTIQQAQLLERLGLDRTSEYASSTYRREATRAGFQNYFGQEELAEHNRARTETQSFQIEITGLEKTQQELETASQESANAMRDALMKVFNEMERQRTMDITKAVEEAYARRETDQFGKDRQTNGSLQ